MRAAAMLRRWAHASASARPPLDAELAAAAAQKPTGVSLSTLLAFGRQAYNHERSVLETSAHFLKHELPIRLAHRVLELDSLPHGLSACAGIRTVAAWYKQSFEEIRRAPVLRTPEDEVRFTALLARILERHGPTTLHVARGIYELRRRLGVPYGQPLPAEIERATNGFLDTFFTSRMGIRTLIGQHLAFHAPRDGFVGLIHTRCQPAAVLADAAADATQLCTRRYGDAPRVELVGGDRDFAFSYVPSYLHHVLFELLKNSCRAVMESHGAAGRALPPVRVVISASGDSEDVTLKVSDEGGGIPRSGVRRLFSYFYTTAPPQLALQGCGDEGEDAASSSPGGSGPSALNDAAEPPMAGLGVGLALSRVYARYWGGELSLLSMEGYGTDAYVYLRRLGDAAEPLSECSDAPALMAARLRAGLPFQSRDGAATAADGATAAGAGMLAGLQGAAGAAHASYRVSVKAVH